MTRYPGGIIHHIYVLEYLVALAYYPNCDTNARILKAHSHSNSMSGGSI